MGLISGIASIIKVRKMKAGSREELSLADITNLIINLPDAKRNVTSRQFDAIFALYKALQKCRTKMELDIAGYYEEACVLISMFNQIAPYEKYSGMEKTEAIFFMEELKLLLTELNSKSESLLNTIRKNEPQLDAFFKAKERDENKGIEEKLADIVNDNRHLCDNAYVDNIVQSGYGIRKEHAWAFYGILIANALYGKEKALSLMDELFMKWIDSSSAFDFNTLTEISFFCGLLCPNGVVNGDESKELSKKYSNCLINKPMDATSNN